MTDSEKARAAATALDRLYVEANWFAPYPTVARGKRQAELRWEREGQKWYLVPIESPPQEARRELSYLDRMYLPRRCVDACGLQQANGSVAFFEDPTGTVLERHMWHPNGGRPVSQFSDAWHLALPEREVLAIEERMAVKEAADDKLTLKGRYVMATATATKQQQQSNPQTAPKAPTAKGGRRARFSMFGGKYTTGKVCRWMGREGFSFEEAVAAVKGTGGEMPSPVTVRTEMGDGKRHPDKYPAPDLTPEEQAALLAFKTVEEAGEEHGEEEKVDLDQSVESVNADEARRKSERNRKRRESRAAKRAAKPTPTEDPSDEPAAEPAS